MAGFQIKATGENVDQVIANVREKCDEQFGAGNWALSDVERGSNPWVEVTLSAGGQMATVEVTVWVDADRLSTAALPRSIEA